MGGPPGQRRFEGLGVEPRHEEPEGSLKRRECDRAHELDGLIASPRGDGGRSEGVPEHGTTGLGEHGDRGTSFAGSATGVGDLGQKKHQATGGVA